MFPLYTGTRAMKSDLYLSAHEFELIFFNIVVRSAQALRAYTRLELNQQEKKTLGALVQRFKPSAMTRLIRSGSMLSLSRSDSTNIICPQPAGFVGILKAKFSAKSNAAQRCNAEMKSEIDELLIRNIFGVIEQIGKYIRLHGLQAIESIVGHFPDNLYAAPSDTFLRSKEYTFFKNTLLGKRKINALKYTPSDLPCFNAVAAQLLSAVPFFESHQQCETMLKLPVIGDVKTALSAVSEKHRHLFWDLCVHVNT